MFHAYRSGALGKALEEIWEHRNRNRSVAKALCIGLTFAASTSMGASTVVSARLCGVQLRRAHRSRKIARSPEVAGGRPRARFADSDATDPFLGEGRGEGGSTPKAPSPALSTKTRGFLSSSR